MKNSNSKNNTSQQNKKPSKEEVKKVRAGVTKKIRFEIFKRDSFKCQYCGKSSPDVILHVDHINPVSKGGENDLLNLITSCEGCNQGKKDRLLTDKSIIEKQKQQLDELNQRREQLEMMIAWRDSLQNFDDEVVDLVIEKLESYIEPYAINEQGKRIVSKWLKKFSVTEILDAAEIAADKKINNVEITTEVVGEFFNYIPRIATSKRKPESEQKIFYVRGILRNRMYVNERQIIPMINKWLNEGGDIDELMEIAKHSKNWTEFKSIIAVEE